MRDTKPLLILLLSIGLIGTWVYHLYDKTQYSTRKNEVFVKDSAAIADAVRDSLRLRYADTIEDMDNRLADTQTGKDSLRNELDVKFAEITQLKNQINKILRNHSSSRDDIDLARKKIGELQQKVDELNGTNSSIEEERTKLQNQMQQLTVQINGLQQNVKTLSDQNQVLAEQVRLAALFVASDITLNAMDVRPNKEEETTQAKKADKFVASFIVQNPVHEYAGAEVVIVIIQPDGKVLQNSDWDAGNFETHEDGIKSFTRKVRFDYNRGEQKQILFSLNPDKFEKGTYHFQLWHKGVMIGEMNKTLG
jgi:predicted nuclease with TOPRIM domain